MRKRVKSRFIQLAGVQRVVPPVPGEGCCANRAKPTCSDASNTNRDNEIFSFVSECFVDLSVHLLQAGPPGRQFFRQFVSAQVTAFRRVKLKTSMYRTTVGLHNNSVAGNQSKRRRTRKCKLVTCLVGIARINVAPGMTQSHDRIYFRCPESKSG